MRWWRRWVKRARAVVRRAEVERELNEELEFHIAQEVQKQVEAGLTPRDARRQAMIAFGGVERYKEHVRNARRFDWLHGLSLDLQLGLRMLLKYPGLAVVGCIGMAVAIAIGAASFTVIRAVVAPALPLDDGDRIIAIQNLDRASADQNNGRTQLHDYELWRREVSAIAELGAFRIINRNTVTADGRVVPARIAEMTASGFRVARVAPLLGRYLVDADERADAPAVVVIGYSVWRSQFAEDANVLGRTIRLGNVLHTVIGVMPRDFAFPVNNRIWIPLRLDPLQYERGNAPPVEVFGRLAAGAQLQEARSQVATIAQRLAAEHPRTHEHVSARLVSFADIFFESPQLRWALYLAQFAITMILVVIGVNVAVLVYARTITRTGEIAVRTALGASRTRIVSQLFAEALVLSSVAAATGLFAAHITLLQVDALMERLGGEQVPFWWDFSLTPATIAYTAVLAIIGAVIIGVIPALKVTGRQVRATLQHLGSGGSGMQLGRTWTVLIVTQVAVAAAMLPIGLGGFKQSVDFRRNTVGRFTTEFLTTPLLLDREGSAVSEPSETPFRTRYQQLQTELDRRLEAEPAVAVVVRSAAAPGMEDSRNIEVERTGPDTAATTRNAGTGAVDSRFFDAFGIRVLAGRTFTASDFDEPQPTAVIVNTAFVERVLANADPLGRRVRYESGPDTEADPARPWYVIVGVVSNFTDGPGLGAARMYHPLADDTYPVNLAVRIRGPAPEAFSNRLRELTLAVDPMLRLSKIATLERALRDADADEQIAIEIIVSLALSTLLLAAAGISALMSVTVARRRREIGILMALGAPPHRVLVQVLARVIKQLALGILSGIALLGAFFVIDGNVDTNDLLSFGQIAVVMTIVGILAAIGPARRGLRIQPTEALRQE